MNIALIMSLNIIDLNQLPIIKLRQQTSIILSSYHCTAHIRVVTFKTNLVNYSAVFEKYSSLNSFAAYFSILSYFFIFHYFTGMNWVNLMN